MKQFAMAALLLLLAFNVIAAGPDQEYVQIYMQIQQGDTLKRNGQFQEAAQKYRDAQRDLQKLNASYPNWNDRIVKFRLSYLSEQLQSLAPHLPVPAQAAPEQPAVVRPGPSAPARPETFPAPETGRDVAALQNQIANLNQALQQAQAETASLQSRLREALSVQPAASDPRELAKAEEAIRSLQKERALLMVALDQERSRLAQRQNAGPGPEAFKQLETERDNLQRKLDDATRDLVSLEERRAAEFQASQTQVAQTRAERDRLQTELETANRRVTQAETAAAAANPERIARLEAERNELRALIELADSTIADLKARQSERLQTSDPDTARIRQIEAERDGLSRELELARRRVSQLKSQTAVVAAPAETGRPTEAQARELDQLRARLAVLEARPAPLTAEERALLRPPPSQLTPPPAITADTQDVTSLEVATKPPAGSEIQIRRAERAFEAGRYNEAEQAFLEVLRQDERNAYTLANLAVVQMEMERFDDAEKNVARALQSAPNDAFALALIGMLRFRQERFDEALNHLSRSAQLSPSNAETQNYLGMTLSNLGQRVPAEAALRKAIQLQPGYASAHNNLAVIYATQEPPFVELARFHYERALSLGLGKNPELEAFFARK